MPDMKDKVDMKVVESEVAKALRPLSDQPRRDDQIPNDVRPRVYPSPVKSPVDDETQKWREGRADKPFEPQRTVVQLLQDIESQVGMSTKQLVEDFALLQSKVLETIQKQNADLATILKDQNDRLARLENSIGVR